ncbi:DEHA2E17622p [Debaryomyces hansenii CBS767]|uniref:DEHA2E17622p n=1 Tax=Debaryomyces hansenii (strain ATCC 36239 / CBS 767 / BCRC 21394 / JCM 1990 / NBRC 0083 / IGC 2968) TaxID=284592 RepID=Q6BP04_DEBHA|nr:DEHA2E17622p [Debaryomyces hansenii CBS767]CAG88326.2 DEHA2E17622p [Debaryomyces hansenii CBS767]|eukprot:XP_460066.2 DEHA2E17622p [Debaryomyces hansenii CBS767]
MEQVDIPSMDTTHLNIGFSQLPLLFSSLSESTNAMAFSNNSFPTHGWLGCSHKDGWAPLSPFYSDISPCFLQGIIFGISSILMIGAGTYQIGVLRKVKANVSNRVSWSFYAKLILVALQLAFQIGLFVTYNGKDIIALSLVLNVVATIVSFGLHYIEQFKTTIPNGILLFYWLFQIILNLGKIVNLNLRNAIHSHFAIITIVSCANAFFILFLEVYFPVQPRIPFKSTVRTSPYDSANVFSKITFNWMGSLMRKGYVQYLTERDLPPLPRNLKSSNTSSAFNHYWNTQTSRPSLAWALSKAFGSSFLIGGVFKGLQDSLAFVQPQLLRLLIKFVNEYSESLKRDDPIPLTKGFMIAGSMFVVSVTQTACLHQYFQRAFDLGMKIKTSLTSIIYNKSLVLSNETKQESSTGDIVNLMSVDVQRLQDLVQNLQIIWSGPFQIILCLLSLHNLLGKAMWAGVGIMLIMIPLNGVIAKYQKKLQKRQMKNKDERSRLISEILNNIKSLKLYGWEHPYLGKLSHVRNEKELRNLKTMGVFGAVSVFTWNLAPFLVSCSTFSVFLLFEKNKTLSTDIVFPALALFNLLSFPLSVVPMVITNIVEAQVALSRLTKFLTSSEIQTDAVIKAPRVNRLGDVAVSVKDGTFLWSKNRNDDNYKVALSQINFESRKGNLDCIVGKVGSGKSSLIQAFLGDLYKLDGDVRLHGKVAYVSQVPWIVNGTVKENILFGHKYDAEFYQHVLKACALTVDLSILPKGDKTEVGEKGISLSGGQKARLSLARAVYARADVYLLDDPLSAVDEHVGRHLIDHVIGPSGLLKSKCKILATNSIGVLSIANNIHMVSNGKIVEHGTYDEIMKQESSLLRQLIKDFGKRKEELSNEEEFKSENEDKINLENLESDCDFEIDSLRRASDASLIPDDERDVEEEEEDEEAKGRKEHLEQGKVKWNVYLQYAKACNPSSVIIFLVSTVLSMLVSVGANVWLKHWSEVNSRYGYNPDILKYLGIYFLLGFGSSALVLVQTCIMWIWCTIQGSKRLHNDMAISVLRAPMSFFETTPIGRILNRFSNDIYKVDEVLGRVFGMFFSNSTKVLFTIIVICFSTWQFIFLILPLGALYVYYQQYYLKTSRELRRLDSVSRSPIFANFQESLNGVSLIRAYGQEERFKFMNESRVDRNMSAYHPAINANRWLAVRLEFLGSIIILGAAGLSILTLKSGHLSAGLVGLSVSYALQVTQSLNWIVRMTVEVETNIVSVERILEYSQLTPEAPEVIEDNRPNKSWPESGKISFNNYSTKYRPELDLVLRNIDLTINPREKVGIVGRTGAGKSSLTLALFRIIESFQGNISIDNVDTSSIGLSDLRHKLSIIPQDSQVFEGTIKSNLDPTDVFTSDQIWKALELSHLKDHVLKMYEENEDEGVATALDVKLSEGGSNLSVGQRQLMCLARALLIPSHILVLDEATAAVDVETDLVLQETIRREFKDRTIMTIAHRLNTIMDSDRIIVLENGEVAEFDTPANLLKNKQSLFYALCKQGGISED